MGTTTTPHTPKPRAAKGTSRALGGMDAVEIKVTIRPDQELRAVRAIQVNEDTADVRLIYFYDTPNLDLFEAGVALRARLIKGDDDNSTVKFRSKEIASLSAEWKRLKGFKLEADWVGNRAVFSASLTCPQKRDEIEAVAKGKRTIDKLFSRDQERFFREVYDDPIDFADLRVLGPIRVLRWKLKQKGFDDEITVEEWRLPNGDDLVEVSTKTPPDNAAPTRKAFDKHLKELGLDPHGAQETKTRTALKYFASLLKAS